MCRGVFSDYVRLSKQSLVSSGGIHSMQFEKQDHRYNTDEKRNTCDHCVTHTINTEIS